MGSDFCCFALRTGKGESLARPLLCVPNANRHLGWLLAPDGRIVEIPGEETAGLAITVRLEHHLPCGPVGLQHSLRQRVMLGHYADVQNAGRKLGFRHLAQDGRQDFHLDPVEASHVNEATLGLASELSAAITSPCRFADMLKALRQGALRAALAEPALRCLPPDELDHLARHLLENPRDLALLQAAMPRNPWFRSRLPRLTAWRETRDQAAPRAMIPTREPSADLAGAAGTTTQPMTLGLVLNGYARAATPARRMACVLATARNEGAYLLEWIAYQRAIGFDHIFLYTNDNTDGSDDLLQLLSDAGIITWFDNRVLPETLPQHRAYAHALSVMPDILDYRWTMIADIDEFVGLNTDIFNAIPDYLSWQEGRRAEAVALPWKTYVATDHDVWFDAPSIARFTRRDSQISSYVKMIFRTNKVWGANPHHPEPIFTSALIHRSESGEAHQQKTTPAQTARPTTHFAWMSHYPFRSAPEMIMKLARGRADLSAAGQRIAADNRIKSFLAQLHTPGLVEDTKHHRLPAATGGRTRASSVNIRRRRLRGRPQAHICHADAAELRRLPRRARGHQGRADENALRDHPSRELPRRFRRSRKLKQVWRGTRQRGPGAEPLAFCCVSQQQSWACP